MTDRNSEVAGSVELAQIGQLLYGFIATQALAVAAKIGLADLVGRTPLNAEELATAVKSDVASLRRLLRALTSIGVFVEQADGRFCNTVLSDLLRSDHPRSARALAIMLGSEFIWRPWGELQSAVLSGQSPYEHVFGDPLFPHLAAHPELADMVAAAMSSASAMDAAAVVAAYDFSRFKLIVDVGGGQGSLLHTILSANPASRGILADQPMVVAGATSLRSAAMAARCDVVGVDFFSSVPAGADAYIMKWVIHDWNDQDALKILKNCRLAIRSDGTLLIIDAVLKPPNIPDPGKLMDLNMLVMAPGGRERTEDDFRALLRDSGFALTRIMPTAGPLSLVESRPV
jgi:hypothetical protein